jgi:hypothetical protein
MQVMFGFDPYPYSKRFTARSPLNKMVKKMKPKVMSHEQEVYGMGKTTVDVAEELEAKYGIVQKFYEMDGSDMLDDIIHDATEVAIESILSGKPAIINLPKVKLKEVEEKFRYNLSNRKYDGVIGGVPTKASLLGISHLRQDPYAAKDSRPSFVDTGMYKESFRVKVEK